MDPKTYPEFPVSPAVQRLVDRQANTPCPPLRAADQQTDFAAQEQAAAAYVARRQAGADVRTACIWLAVDRNAVDAGRLPVPWNGMQQPPMRLLGDAAGWQLLASIDGHGAVASLEPVDRSGWSDDCSHLLATMSDGAKFRIDYDGELTAIDVSEVSAVPSTALPDPTEVHLRHPLFDVIWRVIKGWDIDDGYGPHGATGNNVRAIMDAVLAQVGAKPIVDNEWLSADDPRRAAAAASHPSFDGYGSCRRCGVQELVKDLKFCPDSPCNPEPEVPAPSPTVGAAPGQRFEHGADKGAIFSAMKF